MLRRLALIILLAALVLHIGCARTSSIIQKESKEYISADGDSNEIDDLMAAKIAGEQAAGVDVSEKKWFVSGCVVGWVPLWGPLIIASVIYDTHDPIPCLAGKSPEYIAAYIDAYKNAAKKEKAVSAGIGCCIGSLIMPILCLIGIAILDPPMS